MTDSVPALLVILALAATGAWALYLVAFHYSADLGHSRSAGLTFAVFAIPQLIAGALALRAPGILIKCIAASLVLSGLAKLRLAYRVGVRAPGGG